MMSRNVMPVKLELMKIGFHEFEVFDWFTTEWRLPVG